MKSRFLSGLVALSMIFAPLAHARVDGYEVFGNNQLSIAQTNAIQANNNVAEAEVNAAKGNADGIKQNLSNAESNLAKTQEAMSSVKSNLSPKTQPQFVGKIQQQIDIAQNAVDKIKGIQTTLASTAAAGSTATAATSSTAAISGTTLAIGAVVVAGAATAIALGSSSGGSSSTPSH